MKSEEDTVLCVFLVGGVIGPYFFGNDFGLGLPTFFWHELDDETRGLQQAHLQIILIYAYNESNELNFFL